MTVLATTAPTPPRAHLLQDHLGLWLHCRTQMQSTIHNFAHMIRQWVGQQPRTPPSYPPAGYGGYGHMSQMSPMGYQVQPCQPFASILSTLWQPFRCPMATLSRMVGNGTMAGRGGMTTAELIRGFFYFNNNCISSHVSYNLFCASLNCHKIPGMTTTGEGVGEAQVQGK